jgi:hypothetical protein
MAHTNRGGKSMLPSYYTLQKEEKKRKKKKEEVLGSGVVEIPGGYHRRGGNNKQKIGIAENGSWLPEATFHIFWQNGPQKEVERALVPSYYTIEK